MNDTPVVCITGVAGGIGRATCNVFSDGGWRVLGLDVQPDGPEGLDDYACVDVSDDAAVGTYFERIGRDIGRLDAIVNNAAIQVTKPLVETTPDEWDRVLGTNLRSVYLTARHGHALLRDGGGAIVNVSSVHAVATSAHIGAYAASKGGMMALTRALAIEFADDDIRVNAVLPGAVDTEMLRAGLNRDHVQGDDVGARLQELGAKHVMGRVGAPAEIGRTIRFLADPTQSSFITGQALIVDGGATARLSTE